MADEQTTLLSRCVSGPGVADRPLMSLAEARDLEAVFKVLANETRLRMLHALAREPGLPVGELASAVGMKPQAVSNQLRRLVDRGIVESRRNGNQVRCYIVDACTVALLDRGLCLTECAAGSPSVATAAPGPEARP